MTAMSSEDRTDADSIGRFLRMPEVQASVGLRKSKIYELIQDDVDPFPAPIRIGGASVWLESEIIDWKARRVAKARGDGA